MPLPFTLYHPTHVTLISAGVRVRCARCDRFLILIDRGGVTLDGLLPCPGHPTVPPRYP